MAYTRIHAIKATVQKALKYICNPEKTEGKLLIDSFACGAETAHYDFKYALSQSSGVGDKKAFHLIQSFTPGEVEFETAHQVGVELADQILENKYSYVIATHVDHDHYHNHIIFCAVDNIEHKKYNDCKRSYKRIRDISDKLCREHGLSVIIPEGQKGKSHYEWEKAKEGQSWKGQMKADIDIAIKEAVSYEHFIQQMREKGYEVKGESFGEQSLKYLSFSAPGQSRVTRVSEKNFEKGYTKEAIKEKIACQVERKRNLSTRRVPFPKRPDAQRTLIDTSQEKFQNSAGLKHWAKVQNLKIVAASYAAGGSIEELQHIVEEKSAIAKEARREMVDLEHELKRKAEILKYAKQYVENKKYQRGYENAKDQDDYLQKHETQLILFGGAENMLKRCGVKLANLDIKKMQAEYDALNVRREELKGRYKSEENEVAEARKQLENVTKYIGMEQEERKEKKHSRRLEKEI